MTAAPDMTERVARAICFRRWFEAEFHRDADDLWTQLDPDQRAGCIDEARAAISAMANPTPAMLQAAWDDTARPTPEERMAFELADNRQAFRLKMGRRYRAMIAAVI